MKPVKPLDIYIDEYNFIEMPKWYRQPFYWWRMRKITQRWIGRNNIWGRLRYRWAKHHGHVQGEFYWRGGKK